MTDTLPILCPHLQGGTCAIATAIYGRTVDAFEQNCRNCGGQSSVDAPHPSTVRLAIHQAVQNGDSAAIPRLLKKYPQARQKPVHQSDGSPPRPEPTPDERVESDLVEMRGYLGLHPCAHRSAQKRVAACQTCVIKGKIVPVHFCNHFQRECSGPGGGIPDAKDGKPVERCVGCGPQARKIPVLDKALQKRNRCRYLQQSPESWAGRYQGGTCFLICGGPSLKLVDWSLLPKRGPVPFAVNNAGAAIPFRPDLWIAADTPGRFAPEIWRDPGISKFTAGGHRHLPIQVWNGTAWKESAQNAADMPNVHFMTRAHEGFDAATYFTSERLQFGRTAYNAVGKKYLTNRTTMLLALRLIVDLGFTTVNIIGADFNMPIDANQYAWTENPKSSRAKTGAGIYRFMNQAFGSLLPMLGQLGVNVWNCTPGGNLDAFPRRSFETACRESAVESSPTLTGLYDYSVSADRAAKNNAAKAAGQPLAKKQR